MGMLTATLLLFGRLSADQELTAPRASGVSVTRLSLPVITISLLMSGFCAWINTDIAPKCRAAYKNLIREVDVGQLTDLLQPGIPMTEIPGQVIHIQNRRTQGNQVGLGNIHYIKMMETSLSWRSMPKAASWRLMKRLHNSSCP